MHALQDSKSLAPPVHAGGLSGSIQSAATQALAKLIWRRTCYGKVSCSISPVQLKNRRRDSLSLLRYANSTIPIETVAERKERKKDEVEGKRKPALDSREKFQEQALTISGWGKLARKHIFSKRGAETIQEVCWIAKQKYDNQGVFCTGTLPSVSGVASYTVMAYSSWIANRIRQYLRDTFLDEYTTVNVWENTKAGRPHFHMAVMSNDHAGLLRILANWHDWWFSVLRDLTRQTGVNLFERFVSVSDDRSLMSWFPLGDATQADAQIVEKDVARYLSKYVSKGARNEATSSFYHPASWWGVDNKTRREAKSERIRLSIGGYPVEAIRSAFASARDFISPVETAHFTFTHPVYLGYGGRISFCEAGDDTAPLSQLVKYLLENGISFELETGV